MITFANFLTREKFDAFVNTCQSSVRPADDDAAGYNAWYQLMGDERERAFIEPAMKFFKAKLEAGELQPCPNTEGRAINFTDFWDTLVSGNGQAHIKLWAMEQIEQMFQTLMLSPDTGIFFIAYSEKQDELNHDQIYANIVEMFDTGNFKWNSINQYQSCGETGEFIRIQFENWTPIMGTMVDSKFQRVTPIPKATAPQSLQIEFKTGDLVAMDWFRFEDALSAFTDSKGADKLPSINANAGVIASTRFYANLDIIHCFVGNSCPHVFTKEGMIVVGENWCAYTPDGRERYSDCDDDGNESEEAEAAYEYARENPPEGMTDHGSVCTDLWWVTMMERSRLIEILIEQLGEEKRQEIEEYAAGEFDVEMQVEPGKYTLYFDGHPSSFYPLLDDKKKFGIGTPYFALIKDGA